MLGDIIKYILFLPFVAVVALGCGKEQALPLVEFTQDGAVLLSGDAQKIEVAVKSSSVWKVYSDVSWCKVVAQEDFGFTATVSPNVGQKARWASLTVRSQEQTQVVMLEQPSVQNYTFKIPVIAHVLYVDQNNPKQYIRSGKIAEMVKAANELFAKNKIGVEWVLATQTPDSQKLAEPGVERISWKGAYPIDSYQFAEDVSTRAYAWDPNEYLNIFVFEFGAATASVGAFVFHPFLPTAHPLEGMKSVPYAHLTTRDVVYVPALYMNGTNIELKSEFVGADATRTFIHELGHFLGLCHVFDENKDPTQCTDSDYCTDTKSYNRAAYETQISKLMGEDPLKFTIAKVVARTSGTGEIFVSDNVMDYAYTWGTQFTPQQYERMRHVLSYGLLVPGPKAIDMLAGSESKAPRVPIQGHRSK